MNRQYLIRTQNHKEWLAVRGQGVGSSEVATLLGLNKWETPYQLWRRKTGQDPPKEENEAMIIGHLMEDAVAQRWAMATGRKIIKESANEWVYVHPEYDYFRASPDRVYWNQGEKQNEENKCILECKTTNQDVSKDNIPQSWFCQVQWLMFVTGAKRASLAWLKLDYRNFGYKDIEYDEDFCRWMAGEADVFWNLYVKKMEEPPLRDITDVMLKYPAHIIGKTVSADGTVSLDGCDIGVIAAVKQLKMLKDRLAELDAQKVVIEDALKMYMGDAEAITATENGKVMDIVTWKAAKGTLKFDIKAFLHDHPKEAEEYMKSVAGSRRFLLK